MKLPWFLLPPCFTLAWHVFLLLYFRRGDACTCFIKQGTRGCRQPILSQFLTARPRDHRVSGLCVSFRQQPGLLELP